MWLPLRVQGRRLSKAWSKLAVLVLVSFTLFAFSTRVQSRSAFTVSRDTKLEETNQCRSVSPWLWLSLPCPPAVLALLLLHLQALLLFQ